MYENSVSTVEENQDDKKLKILMDLLSHDINNHIYGSMGYLELMQSMLQDNPMLLRYLGNSMSELKSISHLVDNVRLLVNISREPFEGEEVDVLSTLNSSSETAIYQIDYRKLDFRPSFSVGECKVKADRFLQDLFTQLFMNSMKYSIEDKAIVKVSCVQMGGKMTIIYEDNGKGISDNLKDRVFTRFDRSVQEGDVHGKGMGLSVVHSVVRRYGGEVSLEDITKDAKVVGTRFMIELPAWSG